MKLEEIRKLSKNELIEKSNAAVLDLRKVHFGLKSGELSAENINKARSLKKDIARMKTIINELELLNK